MQFVIANLIMCIISYSFFLQLDFLFIYLSEINNCVGNAFIFPLVTSINILIFKIKLYLAA